MNHSRTTLPITGVYCAQVTPITNAGVPDHERAVGGARALIASGCDGIALLGTTGEANSFALRERMALLEAMVSGGVAVHRLLPGTGVPAVNEAAELARHALSLGVCNVVVLPPYYYKSPSHEGLLAFYSRLVEQIGDDRLRVLLYHIPQAAQVPVSIELILALRERFPGIFIGVKDSGGELEHMREYIEALPDFSVFAGADTLLRPGLDIGGAGSVTATSNLLAAELSFIFANAHDADQAAALAKAELIVAAVRNISQQWPQIPTIRAMLAVQTGDPGWLMPMPPFLPLNEHQRADLASAMANVALPQLNLPDAPRGFSTLRAGFSRIGQTAPAESPATDSLRAPHGQSAASS